MRPPTTDLRLAACLERYREVGGNATLAVLESVDSTNRLARRIADVYLAAHRQPPPTVVLARAQSAGRGRRGRSWSSPAGAGIYTSLLLTVKESEGLAALPLRVPLELCRLLEEHGVNCAIKWPNDLLVDGRKLGGILIEALAAGSVVVGYGLNGSQQEVDLPVAGATSLRLAKGAEVDLSRLAVDLAAGLLERLAVGEVRGEVVGAYRRRSAHRAGDRLTVRLEGESLSGIFTGFDDGGRLCIETDAGARSLSSVEMLVDESSSTAAGTDSAAAGGTTGEEA